MSLLATIITAWAAVYGYVCVYYCALSLSRRDDREYLDFGVFSGAMTVYAIGQALFVDADNEEAGGMAMKLVAGATIVAVPCFVQLCLDLAGKRSRLSALAMVWAVIGVAALVGDLLVDESRAGPAPTWGIPSAPDYAEARITLPGELFVVAGLILAGLALRSLFPLRRQDRDVRRLIAGLGPAVVLATHDSLIRIAGLRSVYLLEHGLVLAVLAMSYVLLDRFVRVDRELQSKTEELGHSYDELQRTQAELVRKNQLAAVGELSALIAHEVRNPLAVIKNAASGLRRANLGEDDQLTLLDILMEETGRLNRLVHDLLAYARPLPPEGRPIQLESLLSEALEAARAAEEVPEGGEVRIDLGDAPEVLYGDPELLRQALGNVIENGLQAMPSGGTLTIRARGETLGRSRAVAIDFEDEGAGMDDEVRAKATSPFFTTRPSGVGLGLAIVERVVVNHGGNLQIETTPGSGTRVTVVLPQERVSLLPGPPSEPAPAAGTS